MNAAPVQSSVAPARCKVIVATASQPGAIAIFQLVGDVEPVLAAVTDRTDWPVGRMRLANLAGIDQGIAVRVAHAAAQIMPHGGLRVVQKLVAFLAEHGVEIARTVDTSFDPFSLYPEAADALEALMLHALANAQSTLAIDLLLDQPRRWREIIASGAELTDADRERAVRLNRLIEPPIVVLAGLPNVGKSTLSNALMGRPMSIAMDQPGTTRDYTAGCIDLAGVVVSWHDTPGVRPTDDPNERRSIAIARTLIERADLLIAMSDVTVTARGEGASVWPELPRKPDFFVINKCDLIDVAPTVAVSASRAFRISARTGAGVVELVAAIRDRLVHPEDLASMRPWVFDERLLSVAATRG